MKAEKYLSETGLFAAKVWKNGSVLPDARRKGWSSAVTVFENELIFSAESLAERLDVIFSLNNDFLSEILVLRYLHLKTEEEIARMFDCSAEDIQKALDEAHVLVQKILDKRGFPNKPSL